MWLLWAVEYKCQQIKSVLVENTTLLIIYQKHSDRITSDRTSGARSACWAMWKRQDIGCSSRMQVIRPPVHWLHSLSREICCLAGVWIWNVTDRCLRLSGLMTICLLLQVFRLGTSDTVRGHFESIKHDCVTLRVMVKVWGPRWWSLYWGKVSQRNG